MKNEWKNLKSIFFSGDTDEVWKYSMWVNILIYYILYYSGFSVSIFIWKSAYTTNVLSDILIKKLLHFWMERCSYDISGTVHTYTSIHFISFLLVVFGLKNTYIQRAINSYSYKLSCYSHICRTWFYYKCIEWQLWFLFMFILSAEIFSEKHIFPIIPFTKNLYWTEVN